MTDINEEIDLYVKASTNRKSTEIARHLIHYQENQDDIIAATKIIFMHGVIDAIGRSLKKFTENAEDKDKIIFTVEEMIVLFEDAILEFIQNARELRTNRHNR